ncbi:MAG: hypothetical protein WD398_06215 [Cyclobacteriaceae bacterium]
MLTYIVEEIEEAAFSKVLENRITQALSLENTYYGSKIRK